MEFSAARAPEHDLLLPFYYLPPKSEPCVDFNLVRLFLIRRPILYLRASVILASGFAVAVSDPPLGAPEEEGSENIPSATSSASKNSSRALIDGWGAVAPPSLPAPVQEKATRA